MHVGTSPLLPQKNQVYQHTKVNNTPTHPLDDSYKYPLPRVLATAATSH